MSEKENETPVEPEAEPTPDEATEALPAEPEPTDD